MDDLSTPVVSFDSFVPSELFEEAKLASRNDQQLLTSLEELVSGLGQLGVDGPRHLRSPNLDARGNFFDNGAQFDVFKDAFGALQDVVIKRVRPLPGKVESASVSNFAIRSHFRTLQLEIGSLSHPIRRNNSNIVKLIAWGYDYPSSNLSHRLPVLFVEKAFCSLSQLLRQDGEEILEHPSPEVKHHICLDIAEGLSCVHTSGLAHGDLKPDNVLIFKQADPKVPYVAKLSDFGNCIVLNSKMRDFSLYGGTDGWLPPEVACADFKLKGDFHSNYLRHSDSFVFGLLVISIFYKHGLPLFKQLSQNPCQEALKIINSGDTNLTPNEVKQKLQRLCYLVLCLQPQERSDISFELLQCSHDSYRQWTFSRAQKCKDTAQVHSHKNADLYQGYAYWSNLDTSVLSQLEQLYESGISSGSVPAYAASTLLGMAIRFSIMKTPGYQHKVLQYTEAAAKSGSLPAQAMVPKLRDALGQSLYTEHDTKQSLEWLCNAASTGSWIALKDLTIKEPLKAKQAKVEFLKNGGYNEVLSQATRGKMVQLALNITEITRPEDLDVCIDNFGNRYLHFAAMAGEVHLIKSLLERGASIDTQNDAGETPLYKACLAGRIESLRELVRLSADASINAQPFNISCLHWLFNFEEEVMEEAGVLLCSRNASPSARTVHVIDGKVPRHIPWQHFPFHWPRGTPLIWASFTGCIKAVDILLGLGAGIDDLDTPGDYHSQSALAMAMYRADSRAVKHLLSRRANPSRLDDGGCSSVHMMAIDYTEMNRLFPMSNALNWWIYHGSLEKHLAEITSCAIAIREAGGNLDIQSRRPGFSANILTPLLDAAIGGDAGATLGLLSAGASADCEEPENRRRLLHTWAGVDSRRLAYRETRKLVFDALLTNSSYRDARDDAGKSFLHYAVYTPFGGDFEYLFNLVTSSTKPLDINASDNDGETPLLLALRMVTFVDDVPEAVLRAKFLIRLGANILVRNNDGCDLTWIVCNNDKLYDTQCLDLIQCRLRSQTKAQQYEIISASMHYARGETALMVAAFNHYRSVVRLFVELGVDLDVVSKGGRTALDYALHAAQWCRQQHLNLWLLNGLLETSTLAPRNSGLLFERTFTESDLGSYTKSGVDENDRQKYFAIAALVKDLVGAGARRAKQIIPNADEVMGPRTWDAEWAGLYGAELSGYHAEMQPYFEHWSVIYDLMED